MDYCGSCGMPIDECWCHEMIDSDPCDYPEDEMDGDHTSALASAGWGTDEDYGDFGCDDDWF